MLRPLRIVTIIAALVALIAGGVLYAQAQGPGGRGGRGPGGFGTGGPPSMGLPLRELNLTEAQQEQVRQLMTQYREQVRALNDRLEGDIRALLTPDQQQQADKLKAEREARMKQRRQERTQ